MHVLFEGLPAAMLSLSQISGSCGISLFELELSAGREEHAFSFV